MDTIKIPRKVNILHLFSFIGTILRKYENNEVILFIDAQFIRCSPQQPQNAAVVYS